MAWEANEMSKQKITSAALLVPAILLMSPLAGAVIPGTTGGTGCGADACFTLTARSGHIALGDGNSILAWGYGLSSGSDMAYPGPVLIVNQGDTVSVTLANELPVPVSMVFPGQEGVVANDDGGGASPGLLTLEVPALDAVNTVTYTFTASHAGTYLYQSGTAPELEIEMGLVGAIIVRPTGFAEGLATDWTAGDMPMAAHPNRRAYEGEGTNYDREYLFFLSDMDRRAHEERVEPALLASTTAPGPDLLAELVAAADPAAYAATLWFINGRNGPDTMHPHGVGWLPLQPLGSLAQMHPGERALMRIVGAGRDLHPFHHHGNNAWLIAHDGRVLESAAGADAAYPDYLPPRGVAQGISPLATVSGGVWSTTATVPDQAISNYTIQIVPGNTYDAIWTWSGIGLKWDIYGNRTGHSYGNGCNPANPEATREVNEDPNSHCVDIPVVMPEQQALTFGGLWSGSAYLGQVDPLPPLQGGLNPNGGFSFMWHSHTERELTNDDIFPGGMMTMMIVEAIPALGGCIDDECTP
jgi:FtsP/CotA-like multicopper oxidase with cupredoxin domain